MNKGHEVSLWAGVAAFFGSLLAIGVFDVINPDKLWEYLGAIVVGLITGGAVYAKERLGFAKARDNGEPPPEPVKAAARRKKP